MFHPPKVLYSTEREYRQHFERTYCKHPLTTFDGIQVFFKKTDFAHCMYESSNRDGVKDAFSKERAERIDWIKSTLTNPLADLYEGWDHRTRSGDPDCRVAVVYEDFVVVVRIYMGRNAIIKANFVTAYVADNSIAKIRSMPRWDKNKSRWFAMLAQRSKPR
jgi:hypothetical protein